MSLVAQYESSPESENGWSEETIAAGLCGNVDDREREKGKNLKIGDEKTSTNHSTSRLPSASSVINDVGSGSASSSVWNNQYKRADEEQTKALERHVKMVNNSKSVSSSGRVNGKKVCWMYRRGRCRLGKKCQMYHDSELQVPEGGVKGTDAHVEHIVPNIMLKRPREDDFTIQKEDNDEAKNNMKLPKKKFGISDDIIPSKKVIKHFETLSGSKAQAGH